MKRAILKSQLSTLFLAFAAMAGDAYAVDYGDPVRYVSDVEYTIKAVYEDSSARYIIRAANEDDIKPVIQNVEEFGAEMSRRVGNLRGNLSGALRDAVDSAGGEVTNFHFDMGSFPKHVSVELIGQGFGNVELRIGPLDLELEAAAKSSLSSNLWTVDVAAGTPEFYIVGDYDIYSGNVSNIRLEGFNFDLNVRADSNFLEVVLLEDLLVDATDNFAAQAEANLDDKLNELSSRQYKLFDVAEALPTNEYVVASGVDIGQEVKDLLSSSVNGQRLKISMTREFFRYSSDPNESLADGSDSFFKRHNLRIEFGSKNEIILRDAPHFGVTSATECNWGECFAPESTVDQPNTNEGWYEIHVERFDPVPSGSDCTWSSTPSYGNGMGGTTYYEYPAIGSCQHSLKKVTTTSSGTTVEYE
jgi:hypothetical protein